LRATTVFGARDRVGGALRGVAAGRRRAALVFVFRAAVLVVAAVRGLAAFGAARLAADFFLAVLALASVALLRFPALAFAAGRLERLVAVRRAVLADFAAVLRPPARPAVRELFRAAFLVPPAALRLAIACSFFGPSASRFWLYSGRLLTLTVTGK
jgi:hypothetical protein